MRRYPLITLLGRVNVICKLSYRVRVKGWVLRIRVRPLLYLSVATCYLKPKWSQFCLSHQWNRDKLMPPKIILATCELIVILLWGYLGHLAFEGDFHRHVDFDMNSIEVFTPIQCNCFKTKLHSSCWFRHGQLFSMGYWSIYTHTVQLFQDWGMFSSISPIRDISVIYGRFDYY